MKSILIKDTTSCDYILDSCPSEEQAAAIVDLSNKERLFICKDGHPVSSAFV